MVDEAEELLSHWLDHPQLQVVKPPEPVQAQWCPDAQLLVSYGEELQRWVVQSITPETIWYAQGLLEKEYWELYNRVTDVHRVDERHATHLCLHQAYREMRKHLENMKFRGRIEDFLPGPVRPPAPAHRVIEADPEPFEELSAILDGFTPPELG